MSIDFILCPLGMAIPVWMRRYFDGRGIYCELVGWTLGKSMDVKQSLWILKK